MTDRFADQMKREAGELEIALNGGQLEQFFRYYELLVERNKVMNLTAITEEQDVVTKHFTDSLSLVKLMGAEALAGKTLMDVGTGAGFPGIPLKIAFPELNVTLLDSLNKRIQFLETVCRELDLPDVACVHARAEEFAAEHRETFDLAVSRAVAALPVLCELCLPLVKPGGKFLAMKSVESDAELAAAQHAIAILGGAVEAVRDYAIPGTDVRHRLIVVEKVKKTPEKYPRMFAKIKKNPL